ncbi:hypothetical protein OZL46_19840 [Bacillus sonorensis]|uniref:hypothetical protein n=1 Tax=Bacillus sonorensis TaxID=119858 RepID=UPI00227FA578|nr:hypothetical protein [Bacillus sonorensis]MCY7858732.1 hypothetical protein [Bacillus sonorensis]MCY8088752.1 hypothetical protein [Bacillus sonorensis]MCZ0070621.1 hypothetical protein [Bacillus sonorensis]MCZ0098009.1 hypothetical protein [Bacillus sonorensis]MEC1516312.1 hypothetical protein [Bacillus sonorensis]
MRILWTFLGFALIGIIMNTIKENFSFTVTTIVLMFFVAACLIFDLVKRKRSQKQSEKKYEFIWWITTLLMVLVMTFNTFFLKIDPLYNIIVVLIHILFMGIVKSRLVKAD